MSRVDVVIPCYKYAHYLRKCVESVLTQQGVDVRVLILDDASPDNTPEVARELLADPRVEYRRHETNKRHIATYNEGLLEWASGDYVLLLSADDLLTPGSLVRAARLLDAHPEVGLVYGRQLMFQTEDALPEATPPAAEYEQRVMSGLAFLETVCAAGRNPVTTPTAVVRTRLLQELGGYRKELPHTADMELWMRIAAHASVGIVDADQAYKRSHGQNMQVGYLTTALRDVRERRAAFAVLFQVWGHRLPDRKRLEQLSVRALAEEAFWAASQAFDRGDAAGCRECLDFALKLYPGIRSLPAWARFRWKQRIGSRVWSVVRPLLDWVRGRSLSTSARENQVIAGVPR